MNRKYRFNLKQALFIGLVAAVGFSGCKKYLDINQNPNNPASVEPSLLLPTTQAALSQVVGNSFQVFGNFWAQYWTQSPLASQYKSMDQYSSVGTDFNSPWLNIYSVALVNADLIINNTASSDNLKGIAYIMKAYGYQLATDAFGDVPLSQALQPTKYINPKYDTQQVVYDSIFVYINKALPLLNSTSSASPGSQDMIFQGDMAQWVAFANTLELRAYLRLSIKDPTTAQAGIVALYKTNPTFLTEDATITYTATGGNENPFYNESVALGETQNVVASSTVVDAFTKNNDPRLGKFFATVSSTAPSDSLQSIPQGGFLIDAYKKVAAPSPLVGATATDPTSATAPVKLISAAESYFLQAEAVARGWGTGDVTALYEAGITASFTATGAGDPTTYINTAPDGLPALTAAVTVDDKVKAIITQKYYAMCGFQGFEAWTEWRRTGYPTFFITSKASIIAAGQMPLRMLYPNSELVSNSNYPGTIPIYTPVWWGLQLP